MTTFGDRLFELGGVPVGNSDQPVLGEVWFVDGTNGLDENKGQRPTAAKKTIQAALTAQIANTTSKGDVIYVLPGTYAESITGAMTKVRLQGLATGGRTGAVIVAPTSANGLATTMNDSIIDGFEWRAPSTSNKGFAAVAIKQMFNSTFRRCSIVGTSSNLSNPFTAGLRIGQETESASEMMINSRIHNCVIRTNSGRTFEPDFGIIFGQNVGDTQSASRKMAYSRIDHNIIYAHHVGIMLNIAATNGTGALIDNNFIGGGQANGPDQGISFSEATVVAAVVDNRITAGSDAIVNVASWATQGNIVSAGGASSVGELPVST